MNREAIRLGIAVLAFALAAEAGAMPGALVPVFSRVQIDAASVTLADLLPATAPYGLRARAARISLGAAPLPGCRRRLSRSAIESVLGQNLARELEIPADVVLERASRRLSRREVFGAIRKALVRNGFANAGDVRPEDVRSGMPVEVTAENVGLRVLGMRLDPTLHLAVFRLWTAKEADVRPFDVMVRPVGGMAQWLERATGETLPASDPARLVRTRAKFDAAPGTAWRVRKPRGKPLVMPWQTASLVLVSGTMEIHTSVEPLERGYLNQVIRVRMKKTKQVFRAKVVAPNCLEAGF